MDFILSSRSAGLETASGRSVTAMGSLQSTAVFGCVRILAESTASLPLILYRRLETGRGKARATDHSLYPVLHDLPNPELTSYELRELAMGHLCLWGNAYLEVQRNRAGRIMGLWPLTPWRVEPGRVAGELVYRVSVGDRMDPNSRTETLRFGQVLHIKGFGVDGYKGLSPIGLARQAVGLALATEEFGSRFFGNGARPGSVLEHPGKLSDQAEGRLRTSWNDIHQGLENAHRVAILEEGMKLHEVGIPPEDAQFLETRKFQVTEIARLYRVPPHMLADLERATYSNIEHQGLEFVMHTLRPWLVRWEQAISRDLFSPAERQTLLVEHLVNALLRGDVKSRYEAYAVGRQWGWLSTNDVREMENMNPVEAGDDYLTPLNMAASADPPDGGEERALSREARVRLDYERRAEATADDRLALQRSQERLLNEATGRIIRREVNDVRRAIRKHFGKRDAADFRSWLRDFYDEHRAFWVKQLLPLLLSFADRVGASVGRELEIAAQDSDSIGQFIEDYLEALAARQVGSSFGQLRALLEEALENDQDPEPALIERLDAWEESRAAQVARDEASQAGNAFARQFYLLAGVMTLHWVNRGSENCPYCRDLNGRVVGIQEFFLKSEVDFQPEGADRPLSSRSNVRHPPLHKGCDCQIVAGR